MLLMERFYAALLEGEQPPRALQEAQRGLRHVAAGELAAYFDIERRKPDEARIMSYDQSSAAWRRFAVMKPEEQPFSHPYYWAAFEMIGDWM